MDDDDEQIEREIDERELLKPSPVRVTVLDGDGLVLIRNNGDVLLAVNANRPSSEAQLLAIGLCMCLESDEWSKKLIERVVTRWTAEKGYDPRRANL